MGCSKSPHDVASAFLEVPTDDGRVGFMLLLSPEEWKGMRRYDATMTNARLVGLVHAQVSALIEQGIAERHLPCPHQWLMSSITPTSLGGMLFSGFCATRAEIRAVHADLFGMGMGKS